MLTTRRSARRAAAALVAGALAMVVTACTAADVRRDPAPAVSSADANGSPSSNTSAVSGDGTSARCVVPIPEADATKLVLNRLDSGESTSFGIEAFGFDPEACRTATRLTSLPATPACAGVFPWIDGDVDHRRQVLGAAGARLAASANLDGRLHQTLVILDKESPALAQLASFASQCGTGPVQGGKDGVRRWKITANAERESWMLMSAGTVLHLRFDMKIGEGFTAVQIQRIADDALRAAVKAGS